FRSRRRLSSFQRLCRCVPPGGQSPPPAASRPARKSVADLGERNDPPPKPGHPGGRPTNKEPPEARKPPAAPETVCRTTPLARRGLAGEPGGPPRIVEGLGRSRALRFLSRREDPGRVSRLLERVRPDAARVCRGDES